MEIVGKVIQVLPIQGGTSAASGKAWQLKTFIIETIENYPRKVAIELFGEQRINDNPVVEGEVYTASVDVESREFNGRWYTSVRAWKVQQGQVLPQQAPIQQPMPQMPQGGYPQQGGYQQAPAYQQAPQAAPQPQYTQADPAAAAFDSNVPQGDDLPF